MCIYNLFWFLYLCDWNWEFVYLDLEFAPVFDWEKIRKRKGKNEIGVLFFAVFRVDSTRMCTLLCPSAAVWLNSISLVFWFWYCYIACFFFCRTWPRRSKFWVWDFIYLFLKFFWNLRFWSLQSSARDSTIWISWVVIFHFLRTNKNKAQTFVLFHFPCFWATNQRLRWGRV